MPEQSRPEVAGSQSQTDTELIRRISTEVLELPEVIRLEPTLRGRLRQLSHSPVSGVRQLDSGRTDGVTLVERHGITEVTVELAVASTGRPAAVVAESIKTLVAGILAESGRESGPIRVAVLAVESRF